MQQYDGERAIEQQQNLARELRRLRNPGRLEGRAQPFLELLLVRGANLDSGMAGHVGELGGCAQESAALPLRMARRLGELKEDAACLFRQSAFGAGEPLRKQREIRLVANELQLTHSDFINARLQYRQYLDLLKDGS